MTYRIHFETPSGDEDSFVVSGETIEEVRELAMAGVSSRGGTNPWSEEIK